MEDSLIKITQLNDFIFCPASIYFHNLYEDSDRTLYQSTDQINGTASHETIDEQKYSTKSEILQGISVYSEKYGLIGKIDILDVKLGRLIERKRCIKQVYDGYVFQMYGQYFGLLEAGYEVSTLQMHSIVDNKNYQIPLPKDDLAMLEKFERTVSAIKHFEMESFEQTNQEKCLHCIYEPACDRCLNTY